ncbi:MAG: Do family serine endopeptidase [Pseudomonadota bacterium]
MKLLGLSRTALIAGLIGAGASAGLLMGPQFQNADARPITIQAPAGAPVSLADLIEQVSPAVVSVNVVSEREASDLSELERFFDRFRGAPSPDQDEEDDGPTREARSLGSGFFISSDGLIVTNNHVVEGATEIEVVLEDGRELDAELVGADAETDLAVLRVTEGSNFRYVQFGNSSELRRGDWVVAVGNPFGLGGTATAGIVSAIAKPGDRRRSSTYIDYLQIDAAINRGNSGGPTFDLYGNVVGVNTAIYSPTGGSVGIGFAITSNQAKTVTDLLARDGKVTRGWLGVTIQDFTDDMADARGLESSEGAIVADLNANGPAKKSGIRRGDVIVEINGRKVTDSTSTTRVVGSLLAGSSNNFVVLRNGTRVTVPVTVGERPENLDASFDPSENNRPDSETETEEAPLGLTLSALDAETRDDMDMDADEPGMVIADLTSDSPLREFDMRPGMVILDVNGQPLTSVDVLEDEIAATQRRGRDKILMAVRSNARTLFVTVDISEAE